jgi:hypothetical protein
LGDNSDAIHVSFNVLKKLEVDRASIQPHTKEISRAGVDDNPFDHSDEEDASQDEALLSHLVRDITDIDFDDADLTTKICDLKASGRKSKSSAKKDKARRKSDKRSKSVSP